MNFNWYFEYDNRSSCTIRWNKTINPKPPRICAFHDCKNSPCSKNEIEWPNPHPGHHAKPNQWKTQRINRYVLESNTENKKRMMNGDEKEKGKGEQRRRRRERERVRMTNEKWINHLMPRSTKKNILRLPVSTASECTRGWFESNISQAEVRLTRTTFDWSMTRIESITSNITGLKALTLSQPHHIIFYTIKWCGNTDSMLRLHDLPFCLVSETQAGIDVGSGFAFWCAQ